MDAAAYKDELWTEIRQLVLDEGPAPEALDAKMREDNVPPECREAIIAELIAFRCAEIERYTTGPLEGAPLTIIMGSWAGNVFAYELSHGRDDD